MIKPAIMGTIVPEIGDEFGVPNKNIPVKEQLSSLGFEDKENNLNLQETSTNNEKSEVVSINPDIVEQTSTINPMETTDAPIPQITTEQDSITSLASSEEDDAIRNFAAHGNQ